MQHSLPTFSSEELIIARIAREIRGELVVIGATVLSDIAVRVAKLLYAPELILVGGSYAAFDCAAQQKGYGEEWSGVPASRMYLSWLETFDIIRKGRYRIWMGPAQVDQYGNSNMSVIGEWQKPDVQLVGARGLPDNLWSTDDFYFHIKRHTSKHLVSKVDFICALGYGAERERLELETGKPKKLVSDLGVFYWDAQGRFQIESLHPGVDFETVQSRTGFKLGDQAPDKYEVTASPSRDELECIRNVVDPKGWRRTEAVDASPELLRRLLMADVK